jgi:hypothetical protein
MADIFVSPELLAQHMGDKADEFIECMRIVQDIIDNPETYGTMMIVKSQAFKRKSSIMSDNDKFVNDIWKTMYEALQENINTLKLSAKGAN